MANGIGNSRTMFRSGARFPLLSQEKALHGDALMLQVRRKVLLAAALLAGIGLAGPARAAGDARAEGLQRMLKAALGDGATVPAGGGRETFLAVLNSEAFLHEAIGPFDVYVAKADALKKAADAKKLLQRAVDGLQPLLPVMEKRFGRATGSVSGHRFPLILCSSRREKGETSYEDVLALLDECENQGYTAWKPDQPVWTDANRGAATARNWEVLLFNVAHPSISDIEKTWYDHGLGYETLNQLCNRLFAKGAWGPPPPWLRQGLLDELDIEAYGTAWVAAGESTEWTSQTAGWRNEGWSGFLPEGAAPPPPVLGPPPSLSKTFTTKVKSDTWLARADSANRHWSALVADRKSESPASLSAMAAGQNYGPRDRAFGRCVMFLLLESGGSDDLLAALDRESTVSETGMRDGDPLPVAVSKALGDLPQLNKLEARPLKDVLAAVGREDLLKRLHDLGASDMLAIADHRDQARWLWSQTMENSRRQTIYRIIVEAEAYEQLGEWEVIGQALDKAAAAALAGSGMFPKQEDKLQAVGETFRNALAESRAAGS
jgi:hypothetical protein